MIERCFTDALPGGVITAMVLVMLAMFLLGFVLDFIEITFIVVPIVGAGADGHGPGPGLAGHDDRAEPANLFSDPAVRLLAVLPARCLPGPEVPTSAIYRGVIPFIVIQLLVLGMLAMWPPLATWLPGVVYSG